MIKIVLLLFILLSLFLFISSMDRYSSIKYSSFDGKNNQEFFDVNNQDRFFKSDKLQNNPDTGRLELVDDYLNEFEVANLFEPKHNAKVIATISNSSTINTNRNIVAINTTEDIVKIYKKTATGSSYTLLYTFVGDYNYPRQVTSFKNKVLVFLRFGGAYTRKLAYSTDFGNSFTVIDWDYDDPVAHVIGIDGSIYVVDEDGVVIKSSDGITWEVFYNGNTSEEQITDIDELDGQLYVSISSQGGKSYLAKLQDGTLQYIYSFKGDYSKISIKSFDNRIIISNIVKGVITFYEYNKGDVQKITTIDYQSYVNVTLLLSTDDFLYFTAEIVNLRARYLFKMNKKNGCFLLKDFGSTVNINSVVDFNGELSFHTMTDTEEDITVFDNRVTPKTVSSGYIELPILDKKHRPVYLIARHKPLGDNSTLTITANINHATGYSTALLSNTVNDSVETIVDLKTLITTDITSIQFKVTFADSSLVNGIEDLEIIYLYNKKGLENLKF